MPSENLTHLTADIVAAHVANNFVAVGDMPLLIQKVHEALSGLPSPGEENKKEPAVSIRASINPDYLVCLECGQQQKSLKRHLKTAHGMTPQEYRQAFCLPADYPMVAPNYAQKRREIAKKIGLGRKPGEKRAGRMARDAKAKSKE